MMLMPKIFDDDFFRDDFFDRKDRMNFNLMKTDIREDDKSYLLEVDLPGYSKDDIKIDITDGYLTINAKVETPFFPIKSPFTSRASPFIKILVT